MSNVFNSASQSQNANAIVASHYAVGMAAHQIEQRGLPPSSLDVQVAGLESMLRVYRLARRRALIDSYPNFDELLAQSEGNTLSGWYAEAATCGGT